MSNACGKNGAYKKLIESFSYKISWKGTSWKIKTKEEDSFLDHVTTLFQP
jgi:hypothetical protein